MYVSTFINKIKIIKMWTESIHINLKKVVVSRGKMMEMETVGDCFT